MSPKLGITRNSWQRILASAVAIFDDLDDKGFGSPDVVIGGGTVLMFRFEHRLSRNIDFFLHDVQWLSLLTPRLNETTAAMVTDYVEQANGIKLVLPHGDIDFVVAGTVTDAAPRETLEFMGRTFRLETTTEILAKKLFFRAERLQPRDVFDLVVAAERDRTSAVDALTAAAAKKDIWLRRLDQMSRLPPDKLGDRIVPVGDYGSVVETMVASAQRLVMNLLSDNASADGCAATDPAATALSAIRNASTMPVTRTDLRRMLISGAGEPSHIMALFSDVSLSTLMRLAIAFEIPDDTLAKAYRHAREVYAAANAEMDAFVEDAIRDASRP